ncbi:hypothetical protein [Treponema endosymbiont of Eucomonympha sp.]|uniref:hypothetical protein n=1 Tax=Treponema endosymbiont of Eucomonympha sp. TaxID=1580831 RepID=UPI000784B34C|nr:hypothetical protein [Treponema endosymbiont of Eucomonympha sp.]
MQAKAYSHTTDKHLPRLPSAQMNAGKRGFVYAPTYMPDFFERIRSSPAHRADTSKTVKNVAKPAKPLI